MTGGPRAPASAAAEGKSSLHEFQAAWHRAASGSCHHLCESFYEFAGQRVRLRVVGRQLAQHVDHTFAHLRSDGSGDPALRIDLWDGEASGVGCPTEASAEGESICAKIGSGVVTISAGGRVFGYRRSSSVTCLDRADGSMIGWRADGHRLSIEERSKPIPLLLRIWYYDRNIDIVHAGLVARGDHGVLIGGHAGSGKSTTALTCLANGFDYLGDDEVGLEWKGGAYVGHSVYGSARLQRGPFNLFCRDGQPELTAGKSSDEKPLHFAVDLAPQRLRTNVRVCSVALPHITSNRRSHVRRVSAGEALLRLGATSLFNALGLGERVFERLHNLVESVPCYSLELGRDAASTVRCVEQILAAEAP